MGSRRFVRNVSGAWLLCGALIGAPSCGEGGWSTPPVPASCPARRDCSLNFGIFQVFIPAAALPAADLNVTATQATGAPSSPTMIANSAWTVEPSSTTFTPPAQVTITVPAASLLALPGVRPSELRLYRLVGGAWVAEAGQSVDTTTLTITAQISDLGTFAVMGIPAQTVSILPLSSFSIRVGDTTRIWAEVRGAGSLLLPSREVTWASSAPAVASVSPSGLVTGRAIGTDTITATSGSASANAVVTVQQVPVASVTVQPPTAILVVGATQQFTATTLDAANNVLVGRTLTWASSNPLVATVNGSGLVSAVAAGTATITATSEGQSGSATVRVGDPTPRLDDFIIRDTRAGGANSIVNATTLSGALTASSLFATERCLSGNCLGVGFSVNLFGGNERAFIWNVRNNAGNPAGCLPDGASEHDWKIWLNGGAVNASGEVFLQYKYWSGQTATGGGAAGNLGVFSHTGGAGGHKDVVWYRQRGGSTTNDGRFTMTSGSRNSTPGQAVLWDRIPVEPGTGSNGGTGTAYLAYNIGVVYDKTDHNNEIVTVTYRLVPESSVGARDGRFTQWINGVVIMDIPNANTGTLGWGEFQIGGPTWICPPQDQTMYFWDIVVWQPHR